MKNQKVSVRWFDGNGSGAGLEKTTLSEITTRLSDAHCVYHREQHGKQKLNPSLLLVLRLATGEVARVYSGTQS